MKLANVASGKQTHLYCEDDDDQFTVYLLSYNTLGTMIRNHISRVNPHVKTQVFSICSDLDLRHNLSLSLYLIIWPSFNEEFPPRFLFFFQQH